MIKKLSDKLTEWIGGWAWFVGSVMADGFEARMQAIAEEEEAEMNKAEEEKSKLPDMGIN